MSTPLGDRAERLLGDFERRRAELAEMRQRMKEVSSTVTAPRRVVAVTVGHTGEVTELTFPTGAYKRMAPAELASVIMKTIGEAHENARKQSVELLAAALPPGFSADALLSGNFDPSALRKAGAAQLLEQDRELT